MNCDLAGRLLDDYLEPGLSQRDRHMLEQHLGVCRRCAEELRRRPALEREVRRALLSSVRPLYLSPDASTRIVEAAKESLNQARRAHRVGVAFRLVGGAVVVALLMVSAFSLMGRLPAPSSLGPTALFPANMLALSEYQPDTLVPAEHPATRLTASSTGLLPRASILVEPRDMRPREPYTMTVVLRSDLAEPLETVRLDLDISGPTGFYNFGMAVKGPLPAHGVSIFRVTPELLAEPCEEQYLISSTDVFSVPGVYTLRFTLSEPVLASR